MKEEEESRGRFTARDTWAAAKNVRAPSTAGSSTLRYKYWCMIDASEYMYFYPHSKYPIYNENCAKAF